MACSGGRGMDGSRWRRRWVDWWGLLDSVRERGVLLLTCNQAGHGGSQGGVQGLTMLDEREWKSPPQAKSPRQSKEHDNNKKHRSYCPEDDGKECRDADNGPEERQNDYSASRKRLEDHRAKSPRQSKEHDNDKKSGSYTPYDRRDHCDADNGSRERGDFSASKQRKATCWGKSARQSKEHNENKKRGSYTPDDRNDRCDADNGSKEQLFVNVGSSHISLQTNLNQTSVNMLVHSAFERAGINADNAKDFYCTFAGKHLHNEKLLSCYSLRRDSTIKVHYLLRAGEQTIDYNDWDEVILNVPRFDVINLPHPLRDMTRNITSARFLSERIQDSAREVLIALCKIFLRDRSLNGNFNSSDILFHYGNAIFADTVQEQPFTPVRARNDLIRIHGIFQPVFQTGNPQDIVLYVDHLLNFLNACPPGVDLRSKAVVTFLTNHFALKNYSKRISTCHMLRGMIRRLVGAAAVRFKNNIGGVPNLGPAWNVPALRTVFVYQAIKDPITRQILRVRYSTDGESFVRLASNFFKHGCPNFPLRSLEAAFSAAMAQGDFLANLLQRLATLNHPLPHPPFDVVKLLG